MRRKQMQILKGKYNLKIASLLAGLLVFDTVVLSVGIKRASAQKADDMDAAALITPVPDRSSLPEVTAASTPEPTATPEVIPVYEPLIAVAHNRTAYEASEPDEGFESEWFSYAENGAYIETHNEYETINAEVYSGGTSAVSAGVLRSGIPMLQGKSINVFLNASSSVSRRIQIRAVNGDTGTEYSRISIDLGPSMQYFEWNFPVPSGQGTYNGLLYIDMGGSGMDAHTVTIHGLRIIGDDDNAAIRANQIGYYTSEQKLCTFIYSCGDFFDVVNAETKSIAYSGAITHRTADPMTGETDYYGDFTNLQVPGTYYIRSQTGLVSHTFRIDADPYTDIRKAALRMLSYQRCGLDLTEWAGELAHPACHLREANLYFTDVLLNTFGGWHDAGDFGRYVSTGTKALNDVLLSYMTAPELFGDDNEGPDSGNGIPDILDEARFELEWLMRMQEEDGGVFSKVTSSGFPDDYVKPEDDTLPLYLFAADTVSTADAQGSFAIASIAFRRIDPSFAEACLTAARKAEAYLNVNSEYRITTNPEGVTAGQYLDDTDYDGRFTAKMAMYAAIGDTMYLEAAKQIYEDTPEAVNSVSWNNNGMYGAYLFLTSEDGEKEDPEFFEKMKEALCETADGLRDTANGNAYHNSNILYEWGSNAFVANNGIILAMAYDVTGEQKYEQSALEQLNYLLGKNCLDMCFVSGYGVRSPAAQHNRLTLSKHSVMSGAMSGGPNASREDNITRALDASTPPARMYVDDHRSYSTNEVAIYYNSALLYLLTAVS